MRNLILGGLGFIGRSYTKKLIDEQEEVIVFDKVKPRLDQYYACVQYVNGNFGRDYDFLSLTQNIDTVYHFLSTTTPASSTKLITEIEENVIATIALLNACIKNNVRKIVFLSSGGTIYGHSYHVPRKETDMTNPINSYGIHKLTIEKYLQLYQNTYDLDCKIIRLSNPYGPFQNPKSGLGAVSAFTYAAVKGEPITIWGDGKVIRDYIYIDDVVDGIFNITKSNSNETLFNLGTGVENDLLDVIQTIENITCKKLNVCFSPARKIDLPYNVLDISKYITLTGSKPKFTLENGIRAMLGYYNEGQYAGQNKVLNIQQMKHV